MRIFTFRDGLFRPPLTSVRLGLAFASLLCTMAVTPLLADNSPIADYQINQIQQKSNVNRNLVQNDLRSANVTTNPQIVYYAVPAMSDVERTPDRYPSDGQLQSPLRIVAAQDEFEPASFELFSFANMTNVQLSVGALRSKQGQSLPADALDLKVVKVWFQNGNGWQSYFHDTGLRLTPELLLNDENMVKVDVKGKANYARLKESSGDKLVWISAPQNLDPVTFNPHVVPFADADRLQPVQLESGQFKQFFLTVHVPANQAPGVYRGAINVSAGGQQKLQIPVAVKVLPFSLPHPATYFDTNRRFLVSFMGGASLDRMIKDFEGDDVTARKVFRKKLINFKNHNVIFPCVDQNEENFALMKELGFPTRPIMMGKTFLPWFGLNFGGRMKYDDYTKSMLAADQCAELYKKYFGHTDVLVSYGDEQGTAFVAAHRNFFKYFHQYGIKMGCAGHNALLYKGGYTYGIHPYGGEPDAQDRVRPWNEIGDKYVGFYASQHTGAENPQYIRRQHGLLSYLNNHSMAFNYEFAVGPWNDRASILYKPMVVAYENRGGLVDTLQWEGFREGIDDIRYATKLKQLCEKAVADADDALARDGKISIEMVNRKLEAQKALQFMALLNGTEMDLNYVRNEMTAWILKLL